MVHRGARLPSTRRPATHAAPRAAALPALTRSLANSPRQCAQRQRISASFGSAAGVMQQTEDDRKSFVEFVGDEGEFAVSEDQFIWEVGATRQGQWLSHLHIFKELDAESFSGQLTIRNRQADNGGIPFAEVTNDAVVAMVLDKFGREPEGRTHREEVVKDLMRLFTTVKKTWARWAREQ